MPDYSYATWRRGAIASLAAQIINRRFATIAEDSSAPILSGSVGSWYWHDMAHGVVSVQVREDAVAAAIALMENEVRRFIQCGPTADEMEQVRKQTAANLRQAIARQANRTASQLATAAYEAVKNDQNVMSPEQRLAMWDRLFAILQPEQLPAIMAPYFAKEERHHSLEITTMLELDQATVAAAFADAQEQEVTPPAQKESKPWPYVVAESTNAQNRLPPLISAMTMSCTLPLMPMSLSSIAWRAHKSPKKCSSPCASPINPAPQVRPCAVSPAPAFSPAAPPSPMTLASTGTTSVRLGVSISDDAVVFSGTALPEEIDQWLAYASGLISDPGWRVDRIDERRTSWLTSMQAQVNDLATRSRDLFMEKVTAGEATAPGNHCPG